MTDLLTNMRDSELGSGIRDRNLSLSVISGFIASATFKVDQDITSWKKLGFKDGEDEALECLQEAKVREAGRDFQRMNDPYLTNGTIEVFAKSIRSLVRNGEATWGDKLTDQQVSNRLNKAKARTYVGTIRANEPERRF